MEYGARKYSPGNYRGFYDDPMSPLHSLIRHVAEVQKAMECEDKNGEGGCLYDEESGFAHVHHILTSALILVQSMRNHGYKV